VEDVVGVVHEAGEQPAVEHGAVDDLDALVLDRSFEVRASAAHEVVEHGDLGDRLVEQLVDDVRSDEPGAADDEDVELSMLGMRAATVATGLRDQRALPGRLVLLGGGARDGADALLEDRLSLREHLGLVG
jgi:hypothetical protein